MGDLCRNSPPNILRQKRLWKYSKKDAKHKFVEVEIGSSTHGAIQKTEEENKVVDMINYVHRFLEKLTMRP